VVLVIFVVFVSKETAPPPTRASKKLD
jgi:hypothetical protein